MIGSLLSSSISPYSSIGNGQYLVNTAYNDAYVSILNGQQWSATASIYPQTQSSEPDTKKMSFVEELRSEIKEWLK